MSGTGSAGSGQQETIGKQGMNRNPYAGMGISTQYSKARLGNVRMDPSIRALQEETLAKNNNLYNDLGQSARDLMGNQSAYIQARVNPLEADFAQRYGALERNLGLRGLSGSSFGEQSKDSFTADKNRALGDARALATNDSLNQLAQIRAQQFSSIGLDAQTSRDRFMQEMAALGLGQQQLALAAQSFESYQNRMLNNNIQHQSNVAYSGGMGGGGEGGSIICTAMNELYGFGEYRNKIWVQYGVNHLTPDHRTGYHYLFLPLVRYGFKSGDGVFKIIVRKALEHIARRRTTDLRAEMRGYKRDIIGRSYRAVLEPLCQLFGILVRKKIIGKGK